MILFPLLAALYFSLLLGKAWLAFSYAKRTAQTTVEALTENTLTLVQPILSGDPLLESRLASNLSELPEQAFLWLIDESDTEAQRHSATTLLWIRRSRLWNALTVCK